MATHSYIYNLEDQIIKMNEILKNLEIAINCEVSKESKTRSCYPENVDVWGSLNCNLQVMIERATKVEKMISEARRNVSMKGK